MQHVGGLSVPPTVSSILRYWERPPSPFNAVGNQDLHKLSTTLGLPRLPQMSDLVFSVNLKFSRKIKRQVGSSIPILEHGVDPSYSCLPLAQRSSSLLCWIVGIVSLLPPCLYGVFVIQSHQVYGFIRNVFESFGEPRDYTLPKNC